MKCRFVGTAASSSERRIPGSATAWPFPYATRPRSASEIVRGSWTATSATARSLRLPTPLVGMAHPAVQPVYQPGDGSSRQKECQHCKSTVVNKSRSRAANNRVAIMVTIAAGYICRMIRTSAAQNSARTTAPPPGRYPQMKQQQRLHDRGIIAPPGRHIPAIGSS